MSQEYDDEINDFLTLNGASLAREFGSPIATHYMELHDSSSVFREYVDEAFRNACDAKMTADEYRYH